MELPVTTRQDAKRRALGSPVRAAHLIAGNGLVRYEDLEAVVPHPGLPIVAIEHCEWEVFAGVLHHEVPAPAQRPITATGLVDSLHERDRVAVQVEGPSVDPEGVPVIDPL